MPTAEKKKSRRVALRAALSKWLCQVQPPVVRSFAVVTARDYCDSMWLACHTARCSLVPALMTPLRFGNAAVMRAEALSRRQGHVGAVGFHESWRSRSPGLRSLRHLSARNQYALIQ